MIKISRAWAAVALVMGTTVAFGEIYSIPHEQIDQKKVYWGVPTGFEKPGEIDYDAIVQATPEYKELKKKKIERGTGKYWILMSQASDRTARAIAQVGQDTEYDLIAAQGYLSGLNPPIPAEDITNLIVDQLEDNPAKSVSKK